jgi:aminomethyltransferase
MITNAPDHLYVVVNAGCAEKDVAHLSEHLARWNAKGGRTRMELLGDRYSLLAIQGELSPPMVLTSP